MKFSFNKNHFILIIIIFIILWVIVNTISFGHLTKKQLESLIVGKEIIEASTGSPNRYYKIYYNKDGTYEVEYIRNSKKMGFVKGKYKIMEKGGKGYNKIDIDEINIPDLHDHVGILHPDHPNSLINNSGEWILGPFHTINKSNNVVVLVYNCNKSGMERIMFVYNN